MEKHCPFLETGPRWQGESFYCCAVGVNFYSVGPERELCQTCPVAHLGDALLCEHLDVYAVLQVNEERKRSVRVEMGCRLEPNQVSDSARCDVCPGMQDADPEGIPGLVSLGDVQ